MYGFNYGTLFFVKRTVCCHCSAYRLCWSYYGIDAFYDNVNESQQRRRSTQTENYTSWRNRSFHPDEYRFDYYFYQFKKR